jgi:hypothetical protein
MYHTARGQKVHYLDFLSHSNTPCASRTFRMLRT